MDKFIKILTPAAGAVVGFLYGEWSVMLTWLLSFVVADYVTGLLASAIEGKLNSKVGFKGVLKKVMIFIVVAIAHVADQALGDGSAFLTAACFGYMGNELLSIVENVGRSGVWMPKFMTDAVLIFKQKGGEE